jgi:hypothetical protein
MAQASEEKLKATVSRQNIILYSALALVAVIAVLAIFVAVYWKHASRETGEKLLIFELGQSIQRFGPDGVRSSDSSAAQPTKPLADLVKELVTELSQQDGLGPDLLRDVGIALLIAVFVTLVIELYASSRLREHISYDVLSAAYAKVVPEEIYTVQRQHL